MTARFPPSARPALASTRVFRLFSLSTPSYEGKTMSHCVQEPTAIADNQIQVLVAKARVAQASFELFSQEQVDAIVKGIGKYVYDNAEMLARMAVDETGIGVYEDKILKNRSEERRVGKESRSR